MPTIFCPSCDQVINASNSQDGKQGKCPNCGTHFVVDLESVPAPLAAEARSAVISSLNARIRLASWLLQSIRIRQAARRAFDLTHLGNGSAERLCSGLILGAAFFFATLLIAHCARLPTGYSLGGAAVALASVMTASGMLVLWKSDAELEDKAPRLKKQLAEWRAAAAEERAALEIEEVRREAAQEAAAQEEAEGARRAIEAVRPRPTTKCCPYCREVILIRAVKCKHCGEMLDEKLREERFRRPQRWNPGVAAVLSFLWPGLGQMYKGQVLNGLAWMFLVGLGYVFCLVPGFFLHVFCIFGAASGSD